MMSPTPRKLSGGHHGLSAREVEADQKGRLIEAMIDLVGEVGYPRATVANVIKRAGVSRSTYYTFFAHRADCFAAAQKLVIRRVDRALKQDHPLAGLARLVAERPALARLIFVASPVAGPGPAQAYLAAVKRWSEVLGRKLDLALPDSAWPGGKGAPPREELDRMVLGGLAAGLTGMTAPIRAEDGGRVVADLTFAVLLPRLGPRAAATVRDQVVSIPWIPSP